MYTIVLVTSLVVAGINGLPSNYFNSPYLTDVERYALPYFLGPFIAAAVANYISSLAAYDPYESAGPQEVDIKLSDGSFNIQGTFEGIRAEGFSNVVMNRMTTPLIPTYVDFDLALPQAQIATDSATASVKFGSYNLEANGSGWVLAENVRVVGRARIRLLGPMEITNVDSVLTIGNIQAEVDGSLSGLNGSTNLNGFLNNNLQQFLSDNSAEVNRVTSEFIRDQFNAFLASS